MDLAQELGKIENLSAVFIPSSSGTTAEGLALGFEKLNISPEIHVAQTQSCHPLVDAINGAVIPPNQTPSLASAIVDTVGLRKDTLSELVKKSGGAGWIITNEEITAAIELVKKAKDIPLSPNSALSIAALQKALKGGRTFSGPIVCLITGD
jgi:threonine synthase